MNLSENIPSGHGLGQETKYPDSYNPGLLFSIPRAPNHQALGFSSEHSLPFTGHDLWHHYEVSWLKNSGVPEVRIARIILPCDSPCLIESKSMKLYFNSLNNAKFNSQDQVLNIITQDLSKAAGALVQIEFFSPDLSQNISQKFSIQDLSGICLDHLDITVSDYEIRPNLLALDRNIQTQETLYSHLFRSCCPVTAQPDWASILINYQGPKINHEALLAYLISYRNHMGFHEDCVERIFLDLWKLGTWEYLSVQGYFTRRGGLDINPVRVLKNSVIKNFGDKNNQPVRLLRQ